MLAFIFMISSGRDVILVIHFFIAASTKTIEYRRSVIQIFADQMKLFNQISKFFKQLCGLPQNVAMANQLKTSALLGSPSCIQGSLVYIFSLHYGLIYGHLQQLNTLSFLTIICEI